MMPTYDYICDACQHEFEAFEIDQGRPADGMPDVPRSDAASQDRRGAAILFKGSGFYQTDYRSDSYKKGAAADKPAESKPASDASTSKSETKSPPAASGSTT